jgi:Na+/melibiose symporter-like transporter
VNLFLALPVTVGAMMLVPRQQMPARPNLDLPGALTAAGGLFLIVFGFDRAQAAGWGAAVTIGSLVGGIALLGLFVLIEARSRNPLLPLRLLENRTRAGSYLAVLFAGIGTFAVFLFVTYFLQQNLGFTPLMSGLAFLPMVATVIVVSVGVNAVLLARLGPRPLVAGGMVLDALGLVLLTRLDVGSSYASGILPSLLLVGAGLGLVFPTATNTATAGVDPAVSGVASSLVNVGQQVGGSLGTALLNTIAVSATTAYLSTHRGGDVPAATVHGYTVAFWWSAAIFLLGALVCGFLLPSRPRPAPAEPVPVAAP